MSWKIEPVRCVGENPGWIYKHKAFYDGGGSIPVKGGMIAHLCDGEEKHADNKHSFSLSLSTLSGLVADDSNASSEPDRSSFTGAGQKSGLLSVTQYRFRARTAMVAVAVHWAAEIGGVVLEVYPVKSAEEVCGSTRLGFEVDDTSSLVERLRSAGAAIVNDVKPSR